MKDRKENVYKILVRKPEEDRLSGGPKQHRWEDNIKVDCKEIRRKSVDWIHVAQNKV